MKFFSPQFRLGWITLLLFIAASVIETVYTFAKKDETAWEKAVENFESTLHQKELTVQNHLKNIQHTYKELGTSILFEAYTRQYSSLFEEDGIAVFVFENDTLQFWSTNLVPIPNLFSNSGISNVAEFNNNFYVSVTEAEGNTVYLGLILIKSQYSYTNDYLQNHFQEDFHIPPGVEISLQKSYKIQDSQDDYLFSLVPDESLFEEQNIHSNFATLLFVSAIFFLFVFLNRLLVNFKAEQLPVKWTVFVIVGIIALRFVMLQFKLPSNFYNHELFDPQKFGQSFWFASLGDFLINSFLLFFFSYHFFVRLNVNKLREKLSKMHLYFTQILVLVGILALEMYFIIIRKWFWSLIVNSRIQFEIYKVQSIDEFTFTGFIILALLFGSFTIVLDKVITITAELINLKWFIINLFVSFAIMWPVTLYMQPTVDNSAVIFFLILISIIAFFRFRQIRYQYQHHFLIVLLLSVFVVWFIINTTDIDERDKRKTIVSNLSSERDWMAEGLILELIPELQNDEYLKREMNEPYKNLHQVQNHIQETYFTGYLDRYEVRTNACVNNNTILVDSGLRQVQCIDYYKRQVENQMPLDFMNNPDFYFLDNSSGRISYMGWVQYQNIDSDTVTLFLNIDSKRFNYQRGFPELLLDENLTKAPKYNYSYAKYKNDQLISKNGSYPYSFSRKTYANYNTDYAFVNINNYNHLIYNIDENTSIIISQPNRKTLDIVIAFAYVFVMFYVFLNIVLLINRLPINRNTNRWDFRFKIQAWLITILSVALLIIGSGIVVYSIKQYEAKHEQLLSNKTESVLAQLEHNFATEKPGNTNWRLNKYKSLNVLLSETSKIFNTEINVFDLNGRLLGTSQTGIFEEGLWSRRMNPQAFYEVAFNGRTKFVRNENIGQFNYLSAYVPLKNREGRVLAYLNLPYFSQQENLRNEIATFIVAMLSIYALLTVIAIVVALIISKKISHPLQLIQEKLQQIELGKKNEQIFYDKNDEIGNLIKEYNRMVAELTRSAELLAKSEREGAWREMAKQIAHEIKNPLTPMKLSIQLLMRSWENNDGDFSNRLRKVSNTLIEQIDRLSTIATGFSNFAKMPRAENKVVDIGRIVQNCVQLFETTENTEITYHFVDADNFYVYADDKQMSQVFINLIKNAVQAIPDHRYGRVQLTVETHDNKVIVSVEDNGTGIPKHTQTMLFRPNFTTKSSGMGMGLPIVKNIVKGAKGEIRFTTELDKGTTFFVELPMKKE